MPNALQILGAGGLAREVRYWAEAAGFDVTGFFEEQPTASEVDGLPVSDRIAPDIPFVAAVGNPTLRQRLVWLAEQVGAKPSQPVCDPRIVAGEGVTVGRGSIVCPGSILTTNIKIHNHCVVNLHCTLGHDVVIEDFVTLAPGVHVSGNVTVRSFANIGTGAAIREKLTIGVGAVVGMGAAVVKDVPDGEKWAGVPAKRMG